MLTQKLYLNTFTKIWLSLTGVYIALQFIIPGAVFVDSIIGLFVPYGIWNFIGTSSNLMDGKFVVLIPIALLALCIAFSGKIFTRTGIVSKTAQAAIVLCLLFALTFITDFCIYGTWQSMTLLLSSGF